MTIRYEIMGLRHKSEGLPVELRRAIYDLDKALKITEIVPGMTVPAKLLKIH